MGHYSRTIDFITVPLTYPSLTLSKCPCQPLIHLIPWLSILTAFGQKGQYFLWRVPECYNIDSKKRKRKERKRKWRSRLHQRSAARMETWCIAIICYQLVSLNFHCSHTHRHILSVRTKKGMHQHTPGQGGMEPEHNRHNPTFHTNTSFPLSFLFFLMKSRLPCRDCMRQTHEQVFPPEERQSKWENDMTALPHNQTPHPELHTTTFVWEAFHCPLYTYKL